MPDRRRSETWVQALFAAQARKPAPGAGPPGGKTHIRDIRHGCGARGRMKAVGGTRFMACRRHALQGGGRGNGTPDVRKRLNCGVAAPRIRTPGRHPVGSSDSNGRWRDSGRAANSRGSSAIQTRLRSLPVRFRGAIGRPGPGGGERLRRVVLVGLWSPEHVAEPQAPTPHVWSGRIFSSSLWVPKPHSGRLRIVS
jgi:hypothetical protein